MDEMLLGRAMDFLDLIEEEAHEGGRYCFRDCLHDNAEWVGLMLVEMLAQAGWQPIESAPLDVLGLVWCPEFGARTDNVGRVQQYPDGSRNAYGNYSGFQITHWMPLPKPPGAAGEG